MIERTRRVSRFRTPPESPLIPAKSRSTELPEIKKIRDKTSLTEQELFPKKIEDFLHLIDRFPEIENIRWIKYSDGSCHFALNSGYPNIQGYGGGSFFENEFKAFVKEVAKRIKAGRNIKFIHKSGDAK